MVPPKKRSKETEANSATDESLKLRKRLRAMVSTSSLPKVDRTLVDAFVRILKSSLFMHDSRLVEIRSVLEEIDGENDRLKGVCQLLDILRRPPAVHSFLFDMLLLFLLPEEAAELGCFEAYRSRMQTLELLVKLQAYQRMAKSRALIKGPLKLIHDTEMPESIDPISVYESLYSWFGSDVRLRDFILPLFPDQPVDASNVTLNEMELVRGDLLRENEADEFENINWSEVFDNDLSSFRQCTCSCHQGIASAVGQSTNHCGLCAIKFLGEHAYIWRGSRLVRAQIEFFDNEEPDLQSADEDSMVISPTKIFSPDSDVIENPEWAPLFEAVDSMENEEDDVQFSSPTLPTTSQSPAEIPCPCLPGNPLPGENLSHDVLKHAFMETFGRHLWGKGCSPLKRQGQSFGIGGPNEESNSASYVFVRGHDGANTMLATVAADSNSSTIPCYPQTSFDPSGTSDTLPGHRTPPGILCPPREVTPVKVTSTEGADGNGDAEKDDEDSWTEEDDRHLLEQFKLHKNIYEAGTAAMAKLQRSRHAVRDRLKLLLDLLKEGV